jgi:RecG-like helicase
MRVSETTASRNPAPTQVLASQHLEYFRALQKWIPACLLTGLLKKSERKTLPKNKEGG